MASQALASLTATYTDSEGEEDMEDGQSTPDKSQTPSPTPKSNTNSPKLPVDKVPLKTNPTKVISAPGTPKHPPKRLVSYNDDTAISDDEVNTVDPEKHVVFEKEKVEVPYTKPITSPEDEILIPPAPFGKCPIELQEKISVLYNKMLVEGKDMNKVIQDRKSFRNPSIYEKLIQFCNINELDTNYPPEIYDPLRWGKESYCEELAKVQKSDTDKREKERRERLAKIEFTGLVKRSDVDDDSKKRKSKWDQAAPNTSSVNMVVKPAGLVQAALTTSATGTKGTVISAFGSLPKKPKI